MMSEFSSSPRFERTARKVPKTSSVHLSELRYALIFGDALYETLYWAGE
jgi:hypothetical protein